MQDAVDLSPIFLDGADSDTRDGEQFGCRPGELGGNGPQGLVTEDAERRHTKSSSFGQTPHAQRLFKRVGLARLLTALSLPAA